jgi:hypothetical protein
MTDVSAPQERSRVRRLGLAWVKQSACLKEKARLALELRPVGGSDGKCSSERSSGSSDKQTVLWFWLCARGFRVDA